MRILQIRFKNLNSLAGEWQIDLTDPGYTADGIFAITGPTGAGKSTLLDAICLALYGRTPRQDRVNASQNEVMSRQTGECFAEVVFETPQGRWCCHWSQHRSRKKADGALQQPRHEVSEADSGKVLVTKLKDVAETVERLTGMDFDRFTRSMLLAQGGFAAFLQANADARAPILEQITGTSIYSDISIAVHQRRGEERQKLEQLKAAQSGLQLLDEEDAAILSRELASLNEQVHQQQQQLDQQQKLLNWRQQLDHESDQLKQLQQAQQQHDQSVQDFVPQQQQLEQARRAEALRPQYEPLRQRRGDLQRAQQSLANLQAEQPTLEQTLKQATQAFTQTQQHQQQVQAELERHQPLIRQLREQDYAISLKRSELQQLRSQLPPELLQGPSPDPALLQAGIDKTQAELEQALSGASREALQARQAEIKTRGEQLSDLKGLVAHSEELQQEQQQLTQTQAALAQQSTAIGEQLEQQRKRVETLQREHQDLLKIQRQAERIADLEQQRLELEAGNPCPLCGSEEHPWRSEQPPELSAEKARSQQVEQQLSEQNKQLQQLEISYARLVTQLQNHQARLEETEQKLARQQRPIETCLQALGWSRCPALSAVNQAYLEAGDAWKQLQQQLKRIDSLYAEQQQQQEEYQRQQQRLLFDAKQAELETLQLQRAELSPEADTDVWEARLKTAVDAAQVARERARDEVNRSEQVLGKRQQQISDLSETVQRLQQDIDQMEVAFKAALEQSRFASEAELQGALLPADQLQQLSLQAEALNHRNAELKALRERCEQVLALLQQQDLTQDSAEHLTGVLHQLKHRHAQLLEQRGSLHRALDDNQAKKQQFGEQQQAIDAQQRELERWNTLHELIGSADGKKFRNFAQGLTFELMVGHANRQLQKMSDRYLLVRDADQPLELNVIDNYQAGEIRSTKNLSGGESFLISLALALGLSGMASRNVRVDSLFLDEGFGTLDEDALETALDTLSGLQQEGKLIGVISHVQALKDRIATRIEVQPVSGGRSRINGPGCRALS